MKITLCRLGFARRFDALQILDEAGCALDSPVEMMIHGSSIVLRKILVHHREGCAGDAAMVNDRLEDKEWLGADLDAKPRGELA